ncbi:MAG: thiol-disulfide oxidoreductase DCC family protein [Candidatus Hydrogenedentes bacterium]|nr:thiol-disulfide oxidoreductase DCC family protein [Candidatus Hydrogenedentota bacterium]
MSNNAAETEHPIILYDGVCNYCNRICNYMIRHDPAKHFRFAHLQSAIGQELLKKYGLSPELDSVVLIEGNSAYIKSDATIHMAPRLSGSAKFGALLRFVPRRIRNYGYDFIARNRYKWWGKQDACIIPTPDVRDRFLA